jgi:hypothetical protein
LNEILSCFQFEPEFLFDEAAKQHEILLHEINIYAYAETKEQAAEDLLDLVEDYVEQYLSDTDKYMKFEKYRRQYPYILRLVTVTEGMKCERLFSMEPVALKILKRYAMGWFHALSYLVLLGHASW